MAAFGSIITTTEEELSTLQVLAADGELETLQTMLPPSSSTTDLVNALDDNGLSPLASAASYGQAAVVAFLLSVGARCDVQDEDGDTPLHTCANAECALLLLGREDCNPNQLNNEGQRAETVHQEELTQLINDTTVVSIHMNEDGSGARSTTEENTAAQDPETMADLERLRLLVNTLAEVRELSDGFSQGIEGSNANGGGSNGGGSNGGGSNGGGHWPLPGTAEEAEAEAAFLALLPSDAVQLSEGVFTIPPSSSTGTDGNVDAP